MIKTKEKLYFAYGSNMNLNQMAFRCPDAEVVESVRLEGYRLAFRTNGGGMALPPFCRKKEAMWTASFGVFPNGTNSIWIITKDFPFIWERACYSDKSGRSQTGNHGLYYEQPV